MEDPRVAAFDRMLAYARSAWIALDEHFDREPSAHSDYAVRARGVRDAAQCRTHAMGRAPIADSPRSRASRGATSPSKPRWRP
jgi:hypothetical protein